MAGRDRTCPYCGGRVLRADTAYLRRKGESIVEGPYHLQCALDRARDLGQNRDWSDLFKTPQEVTFLIDPLT